MDALRSMAALFWFFSLFDMPIGHAGSLQFVLLLSQCISEETACPPGDMVRLYTPVLVSGTLRSRSLRDARYEALDWLLERKNYVSV